MALFDKKGKKLTLDEILKGIDNLPEEEKAKVKSKMDDIYKAEDEREIDKIEEDKASDDQVKDDKAEDVKSESEEIGKEVDEVESEIEEDEEDSEKDTETDISPEEIDEDDELIDKTPTDETKDVEVDETVAEEVDDKEDEKNDVIERLTARVKELESFMSDVVPLVELMRDYTSKQAKKFGYEGAIPGAKKDFKDMDADELSKHIASEI